MSISKSKAGLQLIHQDSLNLQSMITHTATLAENVSAKVRRLDEARVCHYKNYNKIYLYITVV